MRRRVALDKVDKHTWQAARCRGPLTLTSTRVYAWDLSVRAAHLDASHGFFNGTSVFLRVLGRDKAPCAVEILPPEGDDFADWRVATTLPRAGAQRCGFGAHRAADYDELIDHPVEMGRFALVELRSRLAFRTRSRSPGSTTRTPSGSRTTWRRSARQQIRLFEPRTRRAPFDRYLFLATVVGDGYGGLEHRDSTALLCARADLPWRGDEGRCPTATGAFSDCASHEYFHTWNIKRIKPAAFTPYDLARENYTRLLWIFEGFTSYYDDLMLRAQPA